MIKLNGNKEISMVELLKLGKEFRFGAMDDENKSMLDELSETHQVIMYYQNGEWVVSAIRWRDVYLYGKGIKPPNDLFEKFIK